MQNRIEELNEIDRVNTKKITTQKNKLSKMATALKNAKKVFKVFTIGRFFGNIILGMLNKKKLTKTLSTKSTIFKWTGWLCRRSS